MLLLMATMVKKVRRRADWLRPIYLVANQRVQHFCIVANHQTRRLWYMWFLVYRLYIPWD